MNKVTGDEAYVLIFEPQGKMDNKIWATRKACRPVIAKMTLSGKKVVLALFFGTNRHIVQASVPRGPPVAGTFYKRKILGKFYKYLKNVDQRQGLEDMTMLQHTPLVL